MAGELRVVQPDNTFTNHPGPWGGHEFCFPSAQVTKHVPCGRFAPYVEVLLLAADARPLPLRGTA